MTRLSWRRRAESYVIPPGSRLERWLFNARKRGRSIGWLARDIGCARYTVFLALKRQSQPAGPE